MTFDEYIANQRANLSQGLPVSFDRVANVVVCIITGTKAYTGETLSAHCGRSHTAGRIFGRLLMPPIDAMFRWQIALEARKPPEQQIRDKDGNLITSHCLRAFEKESRLMYHPPEYRMYLPTELR